MSWRPWFVATAATLAALPAVAAGLAAPHVATTSIDSLTVPARPFTREGDADRSVDAALERAHHENKRLLIDLGANWCADCRILIAIMELPEIRAFVATHYIVVNVDIGRLDKNLQIPARFGVTDRLKAVPSILIVTPDGHLVNAGHTQALEGTKDMTPQAVANWLATWAQP
jgi:thiol-disulfide isomerase/thioredoxin